MKIERAIEVLAHAPSAQNPTAVTDYFEAVKLGIEALKQVMESRFDPSTWAPQPLPGETK
jgi:hypothetical protein